MSETGQCSVAAAGAEPAVAPSSVSVGRQLRQAREAAQLSRHEVAQALKFSPRQIEALEADDYGALPGATIVRGFVRSYARLLRLDAAPLLRQLEAVMPSMPAEVRPPENMGIANQPRGVREFSPLVTVAIVLLIAAAMLAAWHFFGASTTRPAATTAGAALPKQALESPQAQPLVPVPAENPAAAPASAPIENVMPPQAVEQADPAMPVLRFSFAARSWVEVTDANGQQLHSGENPGGTQLTLTGKPPFDVVVGNAGKVTLTYGEKRVDLAPYTRAEVARFTLE